MLVLRRQGPAGAQIWLPARPTRGIWGGLRSLPECPLDASALALAPARADLPWTSWCEALAADLGVTATGLAAHGRAQARALPALDHAFTHFRLRMYPWLLELDPLAPMRVDEPVSAGGHWALLADRETLPLPAPIKRLLAQLEST
ncbi:MAG: NUDIX domain-containing protein [Burkholderiaceae bacterium]